MEDISLHDNFLISYSVFCRERKIHLHTAFLDKEPREYADVIFSGVVGYHFEGDNLSTVIFDIAEVDVEDIYSEYQDLFARTKNYGWPIPYESKEELFQNMKDGNVKAFIIHSSYGLSGWVWAQGVSKMLRDKTEREI